MRRLGSVISKHSTMKIIDGIHSDAIDCVTNCKIALCNIDSPSTGLFASILFDWRHVNKLKENKNG